MLNVLFVLAAVLKGRIVLGVVGLFVPIVALVATCRLARPGSPWARRFYAEGSRRLERSRKRFPDSRRMRWEPVVDLFAGRPPAESRGRPTLGPARDVATSSTVGPRDARATT